MPELISKLVYGFEIGVTGNWQVENAQLDNGGQRPQLIVDWYSDIDDYPNFLPKAWNQLYQGIPANFRPPASDDAQRQAIAQSYYAVDFEDIGLEGQLNRALIITDLRYDIGGRDVQIVNPGALQARPISGRYSEKLRRALNALGLSPVQQYSQWMLAGTYF